MPKMQIEIFLKYAGEKKKKKKKKRIALVSDLSNIRYLQDLITTQCCLQTAALQKSSWG